MKLRSLFRIGSFFCCWMGCFSSSFALINYGSDDAKYTSPPSGVGVGVWNSVVSIVGWKEEMEEKTEEERKETYYNASAVYIGDRFFLTANHVDATNGSQILINGIKFTLDTGFYGTGVLKVGDIPEIIDNPDFNPDLKLFRVLEEPVNFAIATLNTNTNKDTGIYAYTVGYGKGKGTEDAGKGWKWGSDSTRTQRWGLSVSLDAGLQITEDGYSYQMLYSPFSADYFGVDIANGTLGDSGGGLFSYIDNEWKLIGITTAVTGGKTGTSYYDRDGEPDITGYVRISTYAPFILSVIPEPSTYIMLVFGILTLLAGTQRKRIFGK